MQLTLFKDPQCEISQEFAEQFMKYMKKYIYGLTKSVWISMAENVNCLTRYNGNLSHQISAKSVKWLWDAWKSLYMTICKVDFVI